MPGRLRSGGAGDCPLLWERPPPSLTFMKYLLMKMLTWFWYVRRYAETNDE